MKGAVVTIQDEKQDWAEVLGFDRLPEHIVDKRVTELMDLSGKKAVVTGAGGDGLGQAIANRLGGLGADIALIGRTLEKVQRRGREVEERWGVKTVAISADMSDWDQVHNAVREAHWQLGGLDIMVNNPVMVAGGLFETQTKEQIDFTVLGSLTMMMYGAHAALQFLLPQGSGKIINIGSVGGRIQQRGLVVYNACKAGVIGFTRNLAHEVALRGVNVLGVAPGIMLNPQLKQYVLDPQDDQERAGRAAMIEAITQQVQLGRASLPEEAANMVAFLATEAADYLCGQTIDVAGGQWMG
ncbi:MULTISPECIES: SDR family NAD(P)-dependent oxidoreductase [Mycobacterium avium complex (MAC)]|uniref:SDR family NAD(P)-dependent oxidoreductase n=1 Tax=Mycobacterium avium complex (MAC) TaxID=120793 RepID=UPI0003D255BC|nr:MULTISPECIES: SDR family NAD(P)-dependent oxidoreductase [Mycobacterium avium complex (MAC)]ETB52444.1 short-chain dehydrogenase [Mycobacterium avium 10-5560]KDP08016.1 short-chain dehydrogenase [Mycobacterium avium subsp. hominissuis 100]MCA2236064.1 SDR family oxidoreductase [Mycobacterium avium]MCA2267195.1 SDR family oxidoreductase [Mycobacterium avium]MCA2280806.1 SDR family oxidoreductase [Mycobacterium avium]